MAWPPGVTSLITPPRSAWTALFSSWLELDPQMQYGWPRVRGAGAEPKDLTFHAQGDPPGEIGPPLREGSMQPGVVGLRSALIAAWEADLRAVRQDTFDVGRGREALVFIQRFYALISELRAPIQRSSGPGGHVHVVDSPELGGPGPRVSQSRIRLRNHGELVGVELFSYAEGASRANHSAGLDREIRVADADPLTVVSELYRTAVDFLQVALNLDLGLSGSTWLYEHVSASHFVAAGRWPSVGEVYRSATREFAVADSYESVLAAAVARAASDGHANGAGALINGNSAGEGIELRLTIDQLQRFDEPQADLDNFVQLGSGAVAAEPRSRPFASDAIASSLGLDPLALTKLGLLVAQVPDVCREGSFSADYETWTFLPSYNVHFFRRVHGIDDFLIVQSSLVPRAAAGGRAAGDPSGAVARPPVGVRADGRSDRGGGRRGPRLSIPGGQPVRQAAAARGGEPDPGLRDDLLDRRRHPAAGHRPGVGGETSAGGPRPN